MSSEIETNHPRRITDLPVFKWVGLLVLCCISFGPLISTLGLYWDDWPSLWFLHTFDPMVFPQAFAADRPAQGWLFALTTTLVGESLLAWQIFGILARWISGVSLFWVLSSLWPRQKTQVLSVVALFLVYPGFLQQYIPITYGHQFLILSLFFVSLGTMIWSIRKPALYWLLTGISILISIFSMFALEYFFGLELLRPAILWLISPDRAAGARRRLTSTLKRWLPYLITNLLFLFWRLTHPTPRGEVIFFNNLAVNPGETLIILGRTIVQDLYEAAVLAWSRVLPYLNFFEQKQAITLAYIAVGASAAIIIFLLIYLTRDRGNQIKSPYSRIWGVQAMLLGLYALIISGWPIWVTDLHLELLLPWDRFTQPMILGSCLLIVGLLDFLIRPQLPKIVFVSLLVGLSAGAQFHYALAYRQDWAVQRAFFWQFAWRVPELEPDTLLLTADLPFLLSSDNSLTAAFNWIYAPELDSKKMPYLLYDINARLGNRLPTLEPDIPISQEYRATSFDGSTSQALVFYYSPPRCLKVLDLYADRHYPNKPGYVVLALPLSRLDSILPGSPDSPALPPFLGPEPKHNWCYYFEKIDLAVQLGQWDQAVKLADQALKSKSELTRDNAPELIPLIIAYARSGDFAKALEISMLAGKLSDKMHYYMCDTWYYLEKDLKGEAAFQSASSEINQKFECTPP